MATCAHLGGGHASTAAILILQLAVIPRSPKPSPSCARPSSGPPRPQPPAPPASDSTPSAPHHLHGHQPRPAPAPPPTSPRKPSPAHLYRTATHGPHKARPPRVQPAGRHSPGHAGRHGNPQPSV
jgi:hypothetical protein